MVAGDSDGESTNEDGIGAAHGAVPAVGRAAAGEVWRGAGAAAEADDAVVVTASAGGSDRHPAWYHNLVANPQVEVRIDGTIQGGMQASVAEEAERERLYGRFKELVGGYAKYETKTGRRIPVVLLRAID